MREESGRAVKSYYNSLGVLTFYEGCSSRVGERGQNSEVFQRENDISLFFSMTYSLINLNLLIFPRHNLGVLTSVLCQLLFLSAWNLTCPLRSSSDARSSTFPTFLNDILQCQTHSTLTVYSVDDNR